MLINKNITFILSVYFYIYQKWYNRLIRQLQGIYLNFVALDSIRPKLPVIRYLVAELISFASIFSKTISFANTSPSNTLPFTCAFKQASKVRQCLRAWKGHFLDNLHTGSMYINRIVH